MYSHECTLIGFGLGLAVICYFCPGCLVIVGMMTLFTLFVFRVLLAHCCNDSSTFIASGISRCNLLTLISSLLNATLSTLAFFDLSYATPSMFQAEFRISYMLLLFIL